MDAQNLAYIPDQNEYNEFYQRYVSLVSEADVPRAYAEQPAELRRLIIPLDEHKGSWSYADSKWTIKELLSHVIDGERMFGYRMFRVSRGDETPIEGFEQDDYVANSNANNRPFAELLDEFEFIRKANVLLLNNFDQQTLTRIGTASGFPVSARALACISIGHVRHHINILNERYLK